MTLRLLNIEAEHGRQGDQRFGCFILGSVFLLKKSGHTSFDRGRGRRCWPGELRRRPRSLSSLTGLRLARKKPLMSLHHTLVKSSFSGWRGARGTEALLPGDFSLLRPSHF